MDTDKCIYQRPSNKHTDTLQINPVPTISSTIINTCTDTVFMDAYIRTIYVLCIIWSNMDSEWYGSSLTHMYMDFTLITIFIFSWYMYSSKKEINTSASSTNRSTGLVVSLYYMYQSWYTNSKTKRQRMNQVILGEDGKIKSAVVVLPGGNQIQWALVISLPLTSRWIRLILHKSASKYWQRLILQRNLLSSARICLKSAAKAITNWLFPQARISRFLTHMYPFRR